MAAKRDFYEVLGVARDASADDIKKAYRKAAMKYHPDRNPGHDAEANFKEASEAYEILADPRKRQAYDNFGHAGVGQGAFTGGGAGVDFGDLFGDVFESFFGGRGGGRRGPRAQRGGDLQYRMELEFDEAVFGCEKKLEIPREELCESCSGSGARSQAGTQTCGTCSGTGVVTVAQGFFSLRSACSRCAGRGRVITDPCGVCVGQGRIQKLRKINVTVPAGVDDDSRLKLRGEGESGVHGGPAGDLYVIFSVKPHEHFKRDGDHVLMDLPLSFTQAALGADLTVPTLRGKKKLHIPAGTQTGKIFRLREEGIDNVHGHGRGDLHVRIVVVTPSKLSKREKELFTELAEIRGDDVELPGKGGVLDWVRSAFE